MHRIHKDLASFLELDDEQLKIVKAAATEVPVTKDVDPTAGSTAVTKDTKEGDNDSGSSSGFETGLDY